MLLQTYIILVLYIIYLFLTFFLGPFLLDPKILIVDEAGIPLLDKYVQVDSTIKLACIVRHISMTSSVVYWLHGDTILNYDLTRGGIK